MYNHYYGFDTDPFRVNPDPRFLYFSESHREALSTLIYAVHQRKGFIVLTGEVGTGKTTVLNALMQKLDSAVQCAYIFNTKLTMDDFLIYLFEELGLERVVPFRKSEMLHRLNHYLIERLKQGKQTLLLIDEAQNLSPDLLEEIRMLSNLETPQSKLIQIMLAGQPELKEMLKREDLRQLAQRVELRHNIESLTEKETREYVRERMLIAGHETGDLFSGGALRAIYAYSAGVPRVINVLCDHALLAGYVRKADRISPAMIQEAAHDVGLADTPRPVTPAPPKDTSERKVGWFSRLTGRRPVDEASA